MACYDIIWTDSACQNLIDQIAIHGESNTTVSVSILNGTCNKYFCENLFFDISPFFDNLLNIGRMVWRYNCGRQKLYVEWSQVERQTMVYKLSTETKDWVTRIPLKTGSCFRCSGRVNSSCSTSGDRRFTHAKKIWRY